MGPKRQRPGRPRLPQALRRSDRIELCLTPAEAIAVRQAARVVKLFPNEWARRIVVASATAELDRLRRAPTAI